MNTSAPESRTATVSVGITPSEKRAIELVATVEGKPISDLLRPAVDEIIARGNDLAAHLRESFKVA